MYFKCGTNKIITARMQDKLYMITHIKRGYQDDALYRQRYHEIVFCSEIINRTNGTTNELRAPEKENYLLWLWRFNHLRPDKIRNLHEVTNLILPIRVPLS
jgi:hypothetical protein